MPINPSLSVSPRSGYVFFPFDTERKFQIEVRPGRLVAAAYNVRDLLDRFEMDMNKIPIRKMTKILENDLGLREEKVYGPALGQLLIGLSFIKPMDHQQVHTILSRTFEASSKLRENRLNNEMFLLTMMGVTGACSLLLLSAGHTFIDPAWLIPLGLMPLKLAMRPILKKILDDFVQHSKEVESSLRTLLRAGNPAQDQQKEWILLRQKLALISRQMRELIQGTRWIWKDLVFKHTVLILEINCPTYEKRIQEIEEILIELPEELGALDNPYR